MSNDTNYDDYNVGTREISKSLHCYQNNLPYLCRVGYIQACKSPLDNRWWVTVQEVHRIFERLVKENKLCIVCRNPTLDSCAICNNPIGHTCGIEEHHTLYCKECFNI